MMDLRAKHLEGFVRGAAFLGTDGGGGPKVGRLLAALDTFGPAAFGLTDTYYPLEALS